MTRINIIAPSELSRQHLVAEYRELPRIFNLVRKAILRGEQPNPEEIPSYTLGRGHVRFFYPRLGFLADRQASIIADMIGRGYEPTFTDCMRMVHSDIPDPWWGAWEPDPLSEAINRARIWERS